LKQERMWIAKILAKTHLHCAASNDRLNCLKILIAHGATIDARKTFGDRPRGTKQQWKVHWIATKSWSFMVERYANARDTKVICHYIHTYAIASGCSINQFGLLENENVERCGRYSKSKEQPLRSVL
jgi:hypothetical protein